MICISSDSSQAKSCTPPAFAFEWSSDSSDSNGWSSYFPPMDYTKAVKGPSKSAESSSKLKKQQDPEKMAFQARKKVLGLPAPKKWDEFGMKPWQPKLPNDAKGKGKKRMC